MRNFNIGNVSDWQKINVSDVIPFDVPRGGFRAVAFDLIADQHVSVRVIDEKTETVVAAGDGHMRVRFAAQRDCAVVVMGAKNTFVALKTGKMVERIVSDSDTYATVEPRRSAPSEEMRRMMHMVRLNTERREKALLDKIGELSARRPAVAPAPAAAASPTPTTDAPAAAAPATATQAAGDAPE